MTPGLSLPESGHPVSVKDGAASLPVTGVSWQGALSYARWLSEKDRPHLLAAERGAMGVLRPSRLEDDLAVGRCVRPVEDQL